MTTMNRHLRNRIRRLPSVTSRAYSRPIFGLADGPAVKTPATIPTGTHEQDGPSSPTGATGPGGNPQPKDAA
jgi:hypothetical protein